MDIFGISSYPKKYRRGSRFNIPVKSAKGRAETGLLSDTGY